MKYILIIFSIIYSSNLYGQDFLNNPDYVYGEGYGNTIEEADENAFASLATTLKSNVKVYITSNTKDVNGNISHNFNQDITLTTSLKIKDCYQYIDNTFNNGYRIYRYINKKEYVNERLAAINSLIPGNKNYTIKFDNNDWINRKHPNFMLGSWYYAYQILDDDLMDLFYPQTQLLKKEYFDKIINTQKLIDVYEVYGCYFNTNGYEATYDGGFTIDYHTRQNIEINNIYLSTHCEDNGEIFTKLFHHIYIEYWDGEKWSDEYEISNGESKHVLKIHANPKMHHNRYISGKDKLKSRISFCTYDNVGNVIRIDNIPDKFYVYKDVEMLPLDKIKKGIDNDVKNGHLDTETSHNIKLYFFN